MNDSKNSSSDFYYWNIERKEKNEPRYTQSDAPEAIEELRKRGFIPILSEDIDTKEGWEVLDMCWDISDLLDKELGLANSNQNTWFTYVKTVQQDPAIRKGRSSGLEHDLLDLTGIFFKTDKDIWFEEFGVAIVCLFSGKCMVLGDRRFPELLRSIKSDITDKLWEAIKTFLERHSISLKNKGMKPLNDWFSKAAPTSSAVTSQATGDASTLGACTKVSALDGIYTGDITEDDAQELADWLGLPVEDLGKVTAEDSQTSATTLGMEDFSGGLGEDGSDSGPDCFPL
jgi:hypothetical protein